MRCISYCLKDFFFKKRSFERFTFLFFLGSSSLLWGCKAGVHNVLRVLRTFEMTETAETFAADLSAQEASVRVARKKVILGQKTKKKKKKQK